ncbi:MAG: hypothetical protein J6K72_08405 [Clostridia bacterium]|nr:hypothetical protein [Clostridia bacterium]
MENRCGAMIERGEVAEVTPEGYRVKSYDRDGVTTGVLPTAGGKTFAIGEKVYFFMFPDGKGLVLAAF